MHIKGLLEMMFDKLAGWIDEFIADMEVRPAPNPHSCSLLQLLLKSGNYQAGIPVPVTFCS